MVIFGLLGLLLVHMLNQYAIMDSWSACLYRVLSEDELYLYQ